MINEIKTFEQRKEELVKKGKEKGFITYEELASSLKGLIYLSDIAIIKETRLCARRASA